MRTPALVLLCALVPLCVVSAACGSTTTTVVNTCPTPSGPGTTHNGDDVTANTTWTAAGSPHHITYSVRVREAATLSLEPCAVVTIDEGYGFGVDGRLEALGTAEHPITITAADPAKPWGFLEVWGGYADLQYANLSKGGAPGPNSYAMLDVWGKTDARVEHARLRHVTLTDAVEYGLTLERQGMLSADSTDVTISGAKKFPVQVRGSALVGSLPPGKYTGNGTDEVLVIANGFMLEDTTWHDRGVPYRVGDENGNGTDFRIGDYAGAVVTWTVEAGVKLKAASGVRYYFQGATTGTTSAFIAHGTADKPIVFTSAKATPAPGDYRGLVFEKETHSTTAMDHLEVRFAGGASQANGFHCESGSAGEVGVSEDAAVAFYGTPAAGVLTSSLFADSAANAVDLAYTGDGVDFLASNTFTNIGKCKVTMPRPPPGGRCPNPVPVCP
jgi:hypothetical protein